MATGRKKGSKNAPRHGWRRAREVYFIQAETLGLIKIGFGECAQRRLQILQAGSPDRLRMIGRILCDDAKMLERDLHMRFSHRHSHGEWHHPGDDLLAFIAEHGQSFAADMNRELRATLEAAPPAERPTLRVVGDE